MSHLADFGRFLWRRKRYWLLPWLVILALLAVLLALGGGAAPPFIYELY